MFLGVPSSEWIALTIKVTVLTFVSYYASNYMLEKITPKKKRDDALRILKSVGIDENIDLNKFEIDIALQVVNPNDIKIKFENIGGLEEIISTIKTDVVSLLKNPSVMKSSSYFRPPKGILLHGPPGCGKTMIAQAAAKECKARFINLNISSLTSKWYGESLKLADALFSLAEKISPCIIFIDELDTFLRSRSLNDHEATAMMKAVFLSKWDGFREKPKNSVIIIGATNRKFHIDEAILSRMELQFEVKLPNVNQRKMIFKKMMNSMDVNNDVNEDELAQLTNLFSGRDIDDVCREASMKCLREYFSKKKENRNSNDASSKDKNSIRKINRIDFIEAINKIKKNFNRYNID